MATKTETKHYDREVKRLFKALEAKGPHKLMRALLVEAEAAEEALALGGLGTFKAHSILKAVRDYLDGSGSLEACERRGKALNRDIGAQLPSFRSKSRAAYDYQRACADLPTVETIADSPYAVALYLIHFARCWTGCSETEAQREQLGHLQTALDSKPRDSLAVVADRSRISQLAN